MGDRVYASFTLGGSLETVEQAEKLCEAIVAEGVNRNDGKDGYIDSIEHAQSALRAMIEAEENPSFYGSEVNYGTFEGIEAAALEIGIWCSFAWDEGGGFPAGYKTISSSGQEYEGNKCGDDAGISVSEIIGALATEDPIAAIEKLIEPVRAATGETMPNFTVSPAVAAWLKIFGEKVA